MQSKTQILTSDPSLALLLINHNAIQNPESSSSSNPLPNPQTPSQNPSFPPNPSPNPHILRLRFLPRLSEAPEHRQERARARNSIKFDPNRKRIGLGPVRWAAGYPPSRRARPRIPLVVFDRNVLRRSPR